MLTFLVYMLCYDIYYYFLHILLHTKYLYSIHKIHHKKYNPDYYDFYTIHILEIPLQSVGLIIPVYFYKLAIYQLLCAIFIINIRGIIIHDKRFINIIGDHHILHHKFINYNYGEYWIDYLFNTHYITKNIPTIKN